MDDKLYYPNSDNKKNSSENLKNITRYFFYNINIWLYTFLEINNFIESWYIW